MSVSAEQIKSIFGQALEFQSAAERGRYVNEACGGDAELRAEVEALLRSLENAEGFLESPASGTAPIPERPAFAETGTVIGPYKLLQEIGEGGMGVVYMAEQQEPVRRKVALKLIKPGMDTRQVIARFEAERQALALMDHPNIARVFDAAATDSGRPYFVMELVHGIPITQYCDDRRLPLRQRLALFIPVCQAVQHAHQKGIIHRDLKPSNVLVADYDERPVAKIIDFGVAKATGQQLTEKTMFTEFGQVVGTIEYMSPEQAKLNQLDIDTRTDVYSLGVLLYELLAGETPFDKQRLRLAALDEMLRIIREDEPPKPSARLTQSETLPSIAANRHLEPRKLTALVRGELDWIVMKCLEKDRNRRYETASGLAADVERYLADATVQACPPSAGYRFRKFARHHKRSLLAAALVLLALLGGVIGTTTGLVQAERARSEEARQRQTAQQNERKAVKAAAAERKAKQAADALAQESQKRLVRLYLNQGTELVDRGQFTVALAWFVKALKLDHDDPGREAVHRLRIATTLDRCPKLVRAWRPPHAVETVRFYPEGDRVLLGGLDWAAVWETKSGKLATPTLDGHFARLSPDGKRIALLTEAGQVQVLDSRSAEVVIELPKIEQPPRFAEFSPDGNKLCVVYGPQTLRIWDLATAKSSVHSLTNAQGKVRMIRFSAAGRFLVAAIADKRDPRVAVWDVETAVLRHSMPVEYGVYQGGRQQHLAVTSDVAAVATDVFVKVFHLADGAGRTHLLSHADGVTQVRASGDGNWLLSCGRDNTARVWNARTGQPVSAPLTHDAPVRCATFSDDALQVVTGAEDGQVSLWSASTGARLVPSLRHPDAVRAVGFSPDGRLLITASDEGGLRLWDLAAALSAPELDRRLPDWAFTLGFNGAGTRLIASSLDGALRVYDTRSHKLALPLLNYPFMARFGALNKDDSSILGTSSDGTIRAWDATNGTRLFTNSALRVGPPSDDSSPMEVLRDKLGNAFVKADVHAWFDATGSKIFAWTRSPWNNGPGASKLACFDANTGKVIVGPLEVRPGIISSTITPDQRHWILGLGPPFTFDECCIEVRSLADFKLIRTFPLDSTPNDLQVSQDGRRLLMGLGRMSQGKGRAEIIDLSTGQPLTPSMVHSGAVLTARFLSDDRQVITAGQDGAVRVWDAATGNAAFPGIATGRRVFDLAVHPDGQWLATGSGTNNGRGVAQQFLRFWAIETGEPISPPFPHDSTINAVAIARDGRLIATVSRDRHVRMWNVPEETRPLEDLEDHVGLIAGVRLDGTNTLAPIDAESFTRTYEDLTKRYPNAFQATAAEELAWHRQQADLYASRGDVEAALWLNRLIELDPDDPELYRRRIDIEQRLKRWDAIPSDVERIAVLESRTGRELAELAVSIASNEPGAEELNAFAMQLVQSAIDQAPHDDVDIRYQRGLIHTKLERWNEAIDDFSSFLAKQPHSAEALDRRGRCYLHKGEFANATEDYSEAIKLLPGESWYWHERGYAHLVLGKHKESIADHSKAIELSDRDAGQRIRRGHSYRALGAFEDAEKDYSRTIELIPGDTTDEHLIGLRAEAQELVRLMKAADVETGQPQAADAQDHVDDAPEK